MGSETLDELLRALRAAVDRDVDVSPLTGVTEAFVEEDPEDSRAAIYDDTGDEMMRLWAIVLLGENEMRLSTGNGRCSMARVSTEDPEDDRGNEPLTPIYPFNQPGEAIALYSGPIGGLYDSPLEETIRLVPFPSPDLRWQMDVPNAEGYSTMDRLGDVSLSRAG